VWLEYEAAHRKLSRCHFGLRSLAHKQRSAHGGLSLFEVSWKHAFHAQFLRRDALRCSDGCDQREVRPAFVPSPKDDGQNQTLWRKQRL
jgi:hypothetical protein